MEPKIAYFSMEYGLNENLHTYAGGLGILAGDHLKGAHDIGLPLVGVGILWRHGYTTQLINGQGSPYDEFPRFQYDFLKDTGVTVEVKVRNHTVAAKVWMVDKYNNAPLYLLDTQLPDNTPSDQGITAHLYGGSEMDRVAQEIVLGIGGIRVLRALGFKPEVYHFNEGHAVLAGTELIREEMSNGASFAEAWKMVRQRIVFTTHTPLAEGNESHSWDILHYMGAHNEFSRNEITSIGGDPFNMTIAGLRLSRLANAVSAIHGDTARHMWSFVKDAAPIIHITNGVHPGTWQHQSIAEATTPDELWDAHDFAKRTLLSRTETCTGTWLDPKVLLVGFARRAVSYKRPSLIFHNMERLEPLLSAGQINLIFAGKAHPQDHDGKNLISHIVDMSHRYRDHIVYLPNYDMRWGRLLTRGCDVWLNNPRPPLEASGTSGIKAAMNGVLNLSIHDGWWPEACQHGVNGWIFGHVHGEHWSYKDMDNADAADLYDALENEVVPTYYENRPRWVSMMWAAIESTREKFSVERMVQQYRDEMYKI